MTLSEMRRVLAERNLKLTRSLGQCFLHDGNQLRRIVAAAELQAQDRVLEIGPGLGPLTELLLARAGKVMAIEKDARLVAYLRERFANTPALTLVAADAQDYLRAERRDWREWKLVSNLPYSVASPILIDLAQNPDGPQRLVVMVQFEVAKRLVAEAGSPDYGVLTLLLQVAYEVRGKFRIPAACSYPRPDVDSACVNLVRRTAPLLPEAQMASFRALVKLALAQRRKTMLKLLRTKWPLGKLEPAFAALSLPPEIRGEMVTLALFAQLTRLLQTATCPRP